MIHSAAGKKIHHGRSIKRIREILRIKQEVLASGLGMTQQAVSQLEQKETVDTETLKKVAEILVVPIEAFNKFDENSVANIFSNTFTDSAVALNSPNSTLNYNLAQEKIDLYERLLAEKDAIIAELRAQLKKGG